MLKIIFKNLDSKTLEQSIIGAIKKIDIPIRPEDACVSALFSYLRGMNDGIREKLRSNLLALNKTKVLKGLDFLIEAKRKSLNSKCTLTSNTKIDEYNSKHKDKFISIGV